MVLKADWLWIGWDGWNSPGGVSYGALGGADKNNLHEGADKKTIYICKAALIEMCIWEEIVCDRNIWKKSWKNFSHKQKVWKMWEI